MWRQATGTDRPAREVIDTPFETDFYDAEQTPKGSYAVGEGGSLVADTGDGWETVVDGGPSTTGRQIRAMDSIEVDSDNDASDPPDELDS